mgnify:FL=1
MSDYFDELIGVTGNQYASKVSEGMLGSVNEYIDTGSYILNALISGSIHKGLPSNKITAFAGESATGKTFFILGIVRQFLADNPSGGVLYFESESALTPEMIEERDIDKTRFIQLPVATIQDFAQQASRVVDRHIEKSEAPLLLCLDSLGMLSTAKEVEDITVGANKVDMTKARIVKGAFRVLTLKLAKAGIPLLVTNHTYKQVGAMFPQDIMGGGCLVDGTNIQLADGSLKNISEIEVGDSVMTMNGNHSVLQTHDFDDKELYEIEFEDGYVVKCSADHKFLVDEEWIRAENIFKDNIVEVDGDNRIMKIVSVKKIPTEKVYDITVEEAEHYILENGIVTHNSGLQYAASNIVFLSKKKEKVGTDVVGNIIHCKNFKSRLAKENKRVDVLLSYDEGLNRYYGLLELAEKYEIFKKVSTRYELPDGAKLYAKQILKDPEKYFTEDVMNRLDEAAKTEFSYGGGKELETEKIETGEDNG